MQPTGKKKIITRLRKANPRVTIPPTLSTFNLVHRHGKVEIVDIKPAISGRKDYFKIPDSPGCCMPEQLMGYIKCQRFDFL